MKSTMILAAWLLWELVQWREYEELGLPVHPLGQMASVCSEMQIIWGHQLVAAVGPQEVSRMASRASGVHDQPHRTTPGCPALPKIRLHNCSPTAAAQAA